MKKSHCFSGPAVWLLLFLGATVSCGKPELQGKLRRILHDRVLEEAAQACTRLPETLSDHPCALSAGGPCDFYSQSDYWWPDPNNPQGPYIQRDGYNNPAIFTGHRQAVIRLSRTVGVMAAAYVLTGQDTWAEAAMPHIRAWFVDPETRMNPNLLYAQATPGRSYGRRTGIVDGLQLLEAAQGFYRIRDSPAVRPEDTEAVQRWFSEYVRWLSTHRYGIDAMNSENSHAFCWILQVAVAARVAGDHQMLAFCRQRVKNVLLSQQIATDGSFPAELTRNKPYGCSLFTLDMLAAVCQVLSTPEDNLWTYRTPDGRSVRQALEFHYPYLADKGAWPYGEDINHFDAWPVAQNALLFGALAYDEPEWFRLWNRLPGGIPEGGEVERNFPLRHPLIWL